MGKIKLKKITQKQAAEIKDYFKESHAYITDLLHYFPNQDYEEESTNINGENFENKKLRTLPARLVPARSQGKKPARSIEELHERLSHIKGKSGLTYKDKLIKKGLKNRLKKKEKKDKRKLKILEQKNRNNLQKTAISTDKKPSTKPVYNSEGKLVFSKFDFLGAKTEKKTIKGMPKDPKLALKKIKEEQMKYKKLKAEGEEEKVAELKDKKAWKVAILKSKGLKVKDDPELLKKTIKKIKKRKEKSKAKWEANIKRVEKEKEERQTKRQANIDARAKDKKMKKLRLQARKGRVIAGF